MSTVVWQESARDELADIWVLATPDDRVVIEGVVLGTERLLAENPTEVGESRTGQLRVVVRPPLTFWFHFSPDLDEVRILRVLRPVPRG